MSWNYSGDPLKSTRDAVRFMIGDVCESSPLVNDEEIAWALAHQSDAQLAAALLLRALATRASREVNTSVGDVSRSCSDIARAYRDRASELDPVGLTIATALILPVFGGLTISGKAALDEDFDAVQPHFKIGQDDML